MEHGHGSVKNTRRVVLWSGVIDGAIFGFRFGKNWKTAKEKTFSILQHTREVSITPPDS